MDQVECPQHQQRLQRWKRRFTPAAYWSIGVWFQMAGMLGAQCGAQHSQVDNNGKHAETQVFGWEANARERAFISPTCEHVAVHGTYVHTCALCVCGTR